MYCKKLCWQCTESLVTYLTFVALRRDVRRSSLLPLSLEELRFRFFFFKRFFSFRFARFLRAKASESEESPEETGDLSLLVIRGSRILTSFYNTKSYKKT